MEKEYPLKLSIIVPVYNVEKYLERCVESLLHQDIEKSEYEIILINDGSTDGSYMIAQRLERENPNVILLTQENMGLSVARNVGMDKAKGKYIMFVDSDDFFESYIIGKLIHITEQNSLDLCFFRTVFEYGNGTHTVGDKQPFSDNTIYDGESLVLNGMKISSVWQNIYSARILEELNIKFYPGLIHQDVEFNYRLYPKIKRIMFVDIKGYHYCVYSESSIRTKEPKKVRKIIESDFYVAKNIWSYSAENNYSESIQELYSRLKNAITLSTLIHLATNRYLDKKNKEECFATAKRLGVYPIRGFTTSWKTTLLGHLLNCEWLYKCLLSFKTLGK